MLDYHRDCYRAAKQRIDEYIENHSETYQLRYTLMDHLIPGYKYNYQLEEWMQNFTSYHMYLEFTDQAETMMIYNRKPIRNVGTEFGMDKVDEEESSNVSPDTD